MKNALVIVDVQNDFCEGGALAVHDGNEVAYRLASLLDTQRHRWDFVVTTQDWHVVPKGHFSDTPDYRDTWPVHCVAGTPGAEMHPALMDIRPHATFRKGRFTAAYSGFEGRWLGQTLGEWLERRDVYEVDVVGIATDHCVLATVLDATTLGLSTAVLLPYCAAVDSATGEQAIAKMLAAGAQVQYNELTL